MTSNLSARHCVRHCALSKLGQYDPVQDLLLIVKAIIAAGSDVAFIDFVPDGPSAMALRADAIAAVERAEGRTTAE